MTVTVPPACGEGPYRIALVCLGNICRSPMADVVLTQRVDEVGLAGRVRVTSSGTADWHVGRPMDLRAATTLTAAGYDATRHRAQQFATSWLEDHDLLRMFRDFDPVDPGGDVPDPYYGGDNGFQEVLTMVERTCAAIVAALQRDSTGWATP